MHPDKRPDKRNADQLRPICITPHYQQFPYGSALIQWGKTWVVCSASVETAVPPFREASGGGWLTAEYNMLPASTPGGRKPRRSGGRESEIQRLIGRALRAAIDLQALGQHTLTVDCDVLQADGGSRVASITGGFVAAALAIRRLQREGKLTVDPLRQHVAAVSLGISGKRILLDLSYDEDCRVDVDLNLAMTEAGEIIEVQGTAENHPFSLRTLGEACTMGQEAIVALCQLQREAIARAENA